MMTWSTLAPAISAAFLVSLVEVVEAFTIVLAVATLRGWRPAALGTATGLTVLAGIVLLLGHSRNGPATMIGAIKPNDTVSFY
jgi:uncharacterized membrane protein